MDYIGMFYFNYEERNEENEVAFMLLVKANDVEDASRKLKKAIRSLRKGDHVKGAKHIYLDRLLQVKSFPDTPIMAIWKSGPSHDADTSIEYCPNGGDHFDTFGFGVGGEESEGTDEPFVTFRSDKRGRIRKDNEP